MRRSRPWIAAAATVSVGVVALVAAARWSGRRHAAPPAPSSQSTPPLAQVERTPAEGPLGTEGGRGHPAWAGLDLARIESDDAGMFAPVDGGVARLTLNADLQGSVVHLLAAHHLPEAAAVVIDVATGKLLAYASHVEHGPPRDLCAESSAPSASVFKIVTAAALVEDAHLDADTKECYSGGAQRITNVDLVSDPRRDRWCTTLGGAMGRSINTVFARLAKDHLTPDQLEAMARRFGYGEAMPFEVPVQPSGLHVPSEPLEFARTAAGFWNTTLSPLGAALMSAIVARGGEAVRPLLVEKVVDAAGAVTWQAPLEPATHRAIARETAEQLTAMMERTVREGTCWHAFHDARGRAFLPSVGVAGKTGTLSDADTQRFYTWFTGFAPVDATAGVPEVAIAVLVVNGPTWQVKANAVGRDILRAYLAAHDVPGVTRPNAPAVARHKHSR
jgi:cell division protein FtsI/penicillin-binding protein 2